MWYYHFVARQMKSFGDGAIEAEQRFDQDRRLNMLRKKLVQALASLKELSRRAEAPISQGTSRQVPQTTKSQSDTSQPPRHLHDPRYPSQDSSVTVQRSTRPKITTNPLTISLQLPLKQAGKRKRGQKDAIRSTSKIRALKTAFEEKEEELRITVLPPAVESVVPREDDVGVLDDILPGLRPIEVHESTLIECFEEPGLGQLRLTSAQSVAERQSDTTSNSLAAFYMHAC